MIRNRRILAMIAVLLGLSLVAAACGSDSKSSTGKTTTTKSEAVPVGGDLVIGAEQEPDCTDWISSCGGSSWGFWMMGVNTMPRVFDIVKSGDTWVYKTNSMLASEPKLETSPNQTLTYTISKDAVWSDGVPITSTDFKYTWDQIKTGKDIYDTTGYVDITSVDDSDPSVAVVTFDKPYAGWRQLFGAAYGIYPSHLLEGKDRNAVMASGYDFSGGPWKIKEWKKGVEIVLVPNDKFWGDKPNLDSVTFRLVPDTAAEFQAYKAGEFEAIYPQPQLDVIDAIGAGITGSSAYAATTGSLEALWMNNTRFPFDSLKVRQAFGYSLDRNKVVEALFGGINIKKASQSLNPGLLKNYIDTTGFEKYTLNLTKVDELMTSDGWAKNGAGFWAKGGKQADIEFNTTAGNARRELTQQVVQTQAKAAGFNITIKNLSAGDFFGKVLPQGDYQLGLYASTNTSLEPNLCNTFCSKNIGTAANGYTGQNWQHVNIPELDKLLLEVDGTLDDESAREAAGRKADAVIAANAISFPLDPLPNILLWSDNIKGPVGDHPIFGPFANMQTWGLAG